MGEDESYHCHFLVENSWEEQEGEVKGYRGIEMGLLDNSDTFVEVLDVAAVEEIRGIESLVCIAEVELMLTVV